MYAVYAISLAPFLSSFQELLVSQSAQGMWWAMNRISFGKEEARSSADSSYWVQTWGFKDGDLSYWAILLMGKRRINHQGSQPFSHIFSLIHEDRSTILGPSGWVSVPCSQARRPNSCVRRPGEGFLSRFLSRELGLFPGWKQRTSNIYPNMA